MPPTCRIYTAVLELDFKGASPVFHDKLSFSKPNSTTQSGGTKKITERIGGAYKITNICCVTNRSSEDLMKDSDKFCHSELLDTKLLVFSSIKDTQNVILTQK